MLPAYVEIMLAVDDLEAARDGCRELASLAEGHEGGALEAGEPESPPKKSSRKKADK